jgi:hypothetical protein
MEGRDTVHFGEVHQDIGRCLANEDVLRPRRRCQLYSGVNSLSYGSARVESFKDYDIQGALPERHDTKVARPFRQIDPRHPPKLSTR